MKEVMMSYRWRERRENDSPTYSTTAFIWYLCIPNLLGTPWHRPKDWSQLQGMIKTRASSSSALRETAVLFLLRALHSWGRLHCRQRNLKLETNISLSVHDRAWGANEVVWCKAEARDALGRGRTTKAPPLSLCIFGEDQTVRYLHHHLPVYLRELVPMPNG